MVRKLIIVTIAVLVIAANVWGSIARHELQIYFLDVGQGDSILIRTPDNKYLLLDGGPDSAVLSQLGEVLPPWQRYLDVVVGTHPDADHIGGLVDVLHRFEVGKLLFNDNPENETVVSTTLEQQVKVRHVLQQRTDDDSDFVLGCCVTINFIWPQHDAVQTSLTTNEMSITFILEYHEFSAFFGGDLPTPYEQKALAEYGQSVDVLKVGHHGSKNSSSLSFLQLCKPQLAVISVGADNTYGHPNQEVLNTLNQLRIKTLRTDQVGRIEVGSDGHNFWY